MHTAKILKNKYVLKKYQIVAGFQKVAIKRGLDAKFNVLECVERFLLYKNADYSLL